MACEVYFVFYTLLMRVSRASKTQSSSSLKVPARVIAHLFNIFNIFHETQELKGRKSDDSKYFLMLTVKATCEIK